MAQPLAFFSVHRKTKIVIAHAQALLERREEWEIVATEGTYESLVDALPKNKNRIHPTTQLYGTSQIVGGRFRTLERILAALYVTPSQIKEATRRADKHPDDPVADDLYRLIDLVYIDLRPSHEDPDGEPDLEGLFVLHAARVGRRLVVTEPEQFERACEVIDPTSRRLHDDEMRRVAQKAIIHYDLDTWNRGLTPSMQLALSFNMDYSRKEKPVNATKRIALFSVSEKTPAVSDFANALVAQGWTIFASEGTCEFLKEAGVSGDAVTDVADVTGMPPLLGHKLVTLHPILHGALMVRPEDTKDWAKWQQLGYPVIDLLYSTLYPMEEAISQQGEDLEAVREKTDIGGRALRLSAAKGRRIIVLNDEEAATTLKWLTEGEPNADLFRLGCAMRAELSVHDYSGAAASHLGRVVTRRQRVSLQPTMMIEPDKT